MAPVDTFWTTANNGARMIDATPGDAYTDPYTILPGSPGVDYTNPQVWIDAGLLFADAVLDSAGLFPDRPEFDGATLADFTVWHSQHQVDYILERGVTAYSPPAPNTPPDPLPAGTRTVHYVTFTEGVTMVLGQDGRKVYNVDGLSLADIATMPLADQEALAGLPVVQAKAASLLMRPVTGETVESVRAEMMALVDALIAEITTTTNYDATERDAFLRDFLFDPQQRVALYPHFFVEELTLYKLRLQDMALFSAGRISEFLGDLRDRFERVKAYHDVSVESALASGLTGGVNAIDGGAAMSRGLGIFLEMESQLFQIALARAYVTATGTVIEPVKGRMMSAQELITAAQTGAETWGDFASFLTAQATDIYGRTTAGTSQQRMLDGPNLIFVLQTFSNYEAESDAQIKSEELQQQSQLLADYSAMQKILNETLNKFEPVPAAQDSDEPPPAETLALLDLGTVSDLTADQRRVASMFDTTASATNNTYHPIEGEKSSGYPADFRPTIEISSGTLLVKHAKTVWDALSVSIGEATKIIGQSSQIQMDAINRLSQQKNRHYELGTNVLNKMTDLLREINS
jgi:hypothetical protein